MSTPAFVMRHAFGPGLALLKDESGNQNQRKERRHENQDKREGWIRSSLMRRRKLKRDHKSRGKEDAMKTKTNVKAGVHVAT